MILAAISQIFPKDSRFCYTSHMSELTWGLFLALAVSAIAISAGLPVGPVAVLLALLLLLVAYRYPYLSFYAAITLAPFLGLNVSIPTGALAFGRRAFGGSVDVGIGEILFLAVLIAWALKILFLWIRRRDRNWRPQLPLVWPYLSLVVAHVVSAFSPLQPDPILVIKYALRPVAFCYIAFIALPVNFIRSRRRLVAALGCVSAVGILAALNGLVSLLFVDASSQFIRRAHPLPIFGYAALGDNHNLLAELLIVTVATTAALALLVKRRPTQRLLYAATALQAVIGLLTFSRTFWIVFALQAAVLAALEYRTWLQQRLSTIFATLLLLVPLGAIMLQIGASNVATSSNSTRLALLEIAYEVFSTSPWIGAGAGTFVDRVGSARVFLVEYGDPLDSHGVIQKIAAETGVVGLAAFAWTMIAFFFVARNGLRRLSPGPVRRAAFFLVTGASGAVLYQCFNTNYWTGKMWLPIGLTLAALQVLHEHAKQQRPRERDIV